MTGFGEQVVLKTLVLREGKELLQQYSPSFPKGFSLHSVQEIYSLEEGEKPILLVISKDEFKIDIGILYRAFDQMVVNDDQPRKRKWNWGTRFSDGGAYYFDLAQRSFSSPNLHLEVRKGVAGYYLERT